MSSPKRDILSNDIIVIVIMIMIVIKIMIPCLAGTDGRLVDKCVTEQTNDARGKWSNVLLGGNAINRREKDKNKKKDQSHVILIAKVIKG